MSAHPVLFLCDQETPRLTAAIQAMHELFPSSAPRKGVHFSLFSFRTSSRPSQGSRRCALTLRAASRHVGQEHLPQPHPRHRRPRQGDPKSWGRGHVGRKVPQNTVILFLGDAGRPVRRAPRGRWREKAAQPAGRGPRFQDPLAPCEPSRMKPGAAGPLARIIYFRRGAFRREAPGVPARAQAPQARGTSALRLRPVRASPAPCARPSEPGGLSGRDSRLVPA